jgi:hypothetical protein
MRKRSRLDSAFLARLDAWKGSREPVDRLDHLLVVAGPYGSGKTTLVAQIAAGALPEEVARLVPRGAERFPQTSGRKTYIAATNAPAPGAGGLLLHYNTLRPPVHNIASFAADPVLRVFDLAEHVTVLTLRPPLPQLLRQFVDRSLVEQQASSAGSRLRRGTVGRLARRAPPGPLAVTPEPEGADRLVGRYRRIYRNYQTPGWLDAWWRRWEDFLATRAAGASDLHASWLEPSPAGAPSFRLLPAPSVSPASSHSGARTPP